MRLLVTRPEADARAMTQRLEADGHAVTIEPLLGIVTLRNVELPVEGAQAVVATSRNALKAIAGHPRMSTLRDLPLVVVGPGTSLEAQALGFREIIPGVGRANDLVSVIRARFEPGKGPLLILAGEVVAFDLDAALADAGFETEKRVVYRSEPRSALTGTTERALREGQIDGVILMSPRTAGTYAELIRVQALQEQARNVVHLCISTATAGALAPLQPVPCEVSVQPNLEEMLALIGRVAAKSRPRT